MARWPHKHTSREGSGTCRRPSGFPGALFLFSGLVSLTELLQSLALGENAAATKSSCIATPRLPRLSPFTASRFNSARFKRGLREVRIKVQGDSVVLQGAVWGFTCLNREKQRAVVALQGLRRPAWSRKPLGADSKATARLRDNTALPAYESAPETKSPAQKPA